MTRRTFNEAAGIHRRKRGAGGGSDGGNGPSMRPPEFTGGNEMLQDVPALEGIILQ